MPRQKDLNRLVRARMNKTGEAYTAARANVVKNKRSVRSENSGWVAEADRAAAPKPSEYAHLAGMSDARDGTYEVSKSRTFAMPVTELFGAWSDAALRRRWLTEKEIRIRTASEPKSMRLDWTDGSIITVGFAAKGKGKSSVAVQHRKLPDRASADRLRKYWSDRLDALGETLPHGGASQA